MNIYIGTDHAGFSLKETLKKYLTSLGHEVHDMGAHEEESGDDYPDFIVPVARAVAAGHAERGIVLGGSGQGEAMAANRIPGVRAAVFYGGPNEVLTLSREHNDANVLSLGARFLSDQDAQDAVALWLGTSFSKDERHVRRIKKIDTPVG